MEFKIQIFQAWEVMGNKPNGFRILDPSIFFGLCVHCHCLLSDKINHLFCVFTIVSWKLL